MRTEYVLFQRESRRPIRPSHSMGHLRATASSRAKNKTLDGSDDVNCVRNDPSHVAYNAQMEIWEIQRELRRGEMVQVRLESATIVGLKYLC